MVEPRPMNADEEKDAMEKVQKAIEIIQKLDGGDEINEAMLAAISEVGGLLRKIISLTYPPLIEKLHELAGKMEKLEEKMILSMELMKQFINNINFCKKLMCPTIVLSRYMRDCIKTPGPESTYNFGAYHKNHSPVELTQILINYLIQDDTNPFKKLENELKSKRNAKLDDYGQIILSALTHLIILEAFSNGLLRIDGKTKSYILMDRQQEIKKIIEEYKMKDESYWPGVQTFLEDFMVKNLNLDNKDKADEIQKKLSSFSTTDAFYIVVFSEDVNGSTNQDFTYFCPNEKSQIIQYRNTEGSHAIIYRSRSASRKDKFDYAALKKQVELCRYPNQLGYVGSITSLRFPSTFKDFALLLHHNQKPEIRSANCPEHETGPGFWIWDADVMCNSESQYHYLIASFE